MLSRKLHRYRKNYDSEYFCSTLIDVCQGTRLQRNTFSNPKALDSKKVEKS